MPKLAVQLVTWNGETYIPHLFASLKKQTTHDWELLILDNASKDGTVDRIKRELHDFPVAHRFIENNINAGFAGGHNILFKETESPFVLLLNQDMYVSSDCFAQMIAYLETHPSVAAVTPRLMRWDFSDIDKVGLEKSFSPYVDALGLKVFRSRRVIEQYTQHLWSDVKKELERVHDDGVLPVFGVSGAFPVYRRQALDAVAFSDGTFLDAAYHSYKEDVDLAYRLQSAGYDAVVLFNIFAYHDRSGAGPKDLADRAAALNKKKQSAWIKYHSYKNHLKTLIKNEYAINVMKDFPWIVWYELKKFVWYAVFDRTVTKGLREVWNERIELCNKRSMILRKRKRSAADIRTWWL